jgi:hypothetical protein
MADKPSRALVIYGDGLADAVESHHSHLHQLAASGSCGFLALRTLPTPHPGSSADGSERTVLELAQLLDVYDIYTEKARKEDASGITDAGVDEESSKLPSMAERFMGMKSTFITNSKPALVLSKRAGFSVKPLTEDNGPPHANATASTVLSLLGFCESSDAKETNELVFLHLDGSSSGTGIEYLNSLIGCVQDASKEGSLAYGHLFLVVVLGYGDAALGANGGPSFKEEIALPSELAALRPVQSYTMKTGKAVEGIREDYPLLAVYNQVAVTRRDEVQKFTFDDFKKQAGNLVMLVDRFLYEVSFKLWKAPKYGA